MTADSDEYLTIDAPLSGTFSDLRSKFLAFAFHVESVDEAMVQVSAIRSKYHDARHIAYAYILGPEGAVFRMNDDGEPSGTAGKPIFAALKKAGLTYALICVVRYFGGIKLGTSRLTKAYRQAAEDALLSGRNHIVRDFCRSEIAVSFSVDRLGKVMDLLKSRGADIRAQEYAATKCLLTLRIRSSLLPALVRSLGDLGVNDLKQKKNE